jgi:hypothetical protein
MDYDDIGTEIESMEEMEKRLRNCGSGVKVRAVIKAIELINRSSGSLDANNRNVALYHLTVALVGKWYADDAISDLAERFGYRDY